MSTVRLVGNILWRDARIAWSYRLNLLLVSVSAFFSVVLWFYLSEFVGRTGMEIKGGDYFAYLVTGTAMMGYVQVVLHTFSQKVRTEQMAGTLEMLLASPSPPFLVLASSALWELLLQTAQTSILLLIGWGFGIRFEIGSLPALFLLFVLCLVAFASMGLIAASLLLVFQKGEPVTPFVGALLALIGNIFFPVDVLPGALVIVAKLLPLPYAVDGLRGLLLEGDGLAEAAPTLGILALFCIVLFPLAYASFTFSLRFARRMGLLSRY